MAQSTPEAISSRRSRPSFAKYDVLDELGHGGMATVYRAHDQRLGRDVAIKVLHPHLRDSTEIGHRFATEARAVAKLRHPNIVEVYDVSSDEDDERYLVVELLRGETLRKILHERGALPPEVAAAIGIELLSALSHAHGEGVIHRDVKPENVIVEHRAADRPRSSKDPIKADASDTPVPGSKPNAEETPQPSDRTRAPRSEEPGHRIRVKLTDFGIAKLLDAQGVTSTGQVLGSPAHMAPEQIEGGDVDERADVFGLGVLLYECMVGHLPFEGSNPAQVLRRVLEGSYAPAERERPQVGKQWSAICDRALARTADERYPSANAMRDALLAEMKKTAVGTPRSEIEAFLDDPEGYENALKERLIPKLCELGAEAKKNGDVLGAAAAYNRALAYAPEDPQLLKIVIGMHRAVARSQMAKRVVPLLMLVAMLGVGSYFAARAFRAGPVIAGPVTQPSTHETVKLTAEPSASVEAVASVSSVHIFPRVPLTAATIAHSVHEKEPPPVTKHLVTLGRVRPTAGVHVALDGAQIGDATEGMEIAINGKADLDFSCADNMCVPLHRSFDGDKDEGVDVVLSIRDATLTVHGDGHTYRIKDHSEIQSFPPGFPVKVPMKRGKDQLTVIDETGAVARVPVQAGQAATVEQVQFVAPGGN